MKPSNFNLKQKIADLMQLIDFQEIKEILGLNSLAKLPGFSSITKLTNHRNFKKNKTIILAAAGTSAFVIAALSFILSSGDSEPDIETPNVAETTTPTPDAHAITPKLATNENSTVTDSLEIMDLGAPETPAPASKPAATTTKTVAVTKSEEDLPFDIIEVETKPTPPKTVATTSKTPEPADELELIDLSDETVEPTAAVATTPAATTATPAVTGEQEAALAQAKERARKFYNRVEASLQENPDQETKARKYGALLTNAGEFERGERFYFWYLKSHLKDSKAFYGLGQLYERSKQWEKACSAYKRVVEIDPQDVMARNSHAWVLATAPDDTVRDGKAALALAQEANKLLNYPRPAIAETIGAAYAEMGNFKAAIKIQKWAIRSAPIEERAAMMEKLKLYRAKQPFRSL